jgi:peptide/nickel transport system ATP-binding protein
MTMPDSVTATPRSGADAVLVARDLTKHFKVHRKVRGTTIRGGVVHAAEDINLELQAGKVTAVVGESGSGKTTVARMLARLIPPTSGQVILDGEPVGRRHVHEYRHRVQLVFQDPFASLNPVHDVRYHLARAVKVHHKARGRAAVDAGVADLLAKVKLEPASQFVRKLPHELSGGQRQRVAIARALAAEPSVLLADEPVSMLDVSIRIGVLNLLGELRDAEGMALLYVTHDIASARYFADTVTVMYAGRVVESGPSLEVTDNPSHPYTQLLLSAAPDPDRASPAVINSGTVPSLINPPSGCRFHPRCPYAMPICSTQAPPDFPVGADHTAACWLRQVGQGSPAGFPDPADARPDDDLGGHK